SNALFTALLHYKSWPTGNALATASALPVGQRRAGDGDKAPVFVYNQYQRNSGYLRDITLFDG
ncbi:MAG: hypothetical protein R6U89_03805, partial [Dehalococcoidia bacterium]